MTSEFIVYPLDGTDTQNTRKVINTMRNIVIGSLSGEQADKTLKIANACFSGMALGSVSAKDIATRAAQFVRQNVRYQSDPEETEYIMYPHVIYREGYGDCDDMTVLFCALVKAAGISSTIQAIKYKGYKNYSHVYALVNGRIYDCTLPALEKPSIVAGDRVMSVRV